ncbi:MAG: MBL fold metallo-hydrolase [Deltaproteobacteria bacterium]|nr:MBL fold metallo-hydrolase [Deltaproteobacteria bacterium]
MKKTVLLFIAVFLFFIVPTVWASEGLNRVAENVYAYTEAREPSPANSFAANAGVVVGRDGVLVIDTLISAKEARRLIGDIKKITDKPIKYVVDTHCHLDHAFGNSEFSKLGATIISQVNDYKTMEKNSETAIGNAVKRGLPADLFDGTEIVLPAVTFTDRLTILLGGEKVELIYPGPSHTSGSLLVYLPERKVLFAGDVMFTGVHPFMGDGDIPGWAKALDFIQSLDVTAIVPGHGPLSSKKDAADMKEYILIFDQKAKELASKSKNPEEIAAELKKVLPARGVLESIIIRNVQMKYLSAD